MKAHYYRIYVYDDLTCQEKETVMEGVVASESSKIYPYEATLDTELPHACLVKDFFARGYEIENYDFYIDREYIKQNKR